jgi:hypothetical protein
VSFAAITLCVASQRVFIVVVYFVIDLVRKHLDTPRIYMCMCLFMAFKLMGSSFSHRPNEFAHNKKFRAMHSLHKKMS